MSRSSRRGVPKLDLDDAAAFLEGLPEGCWTTYGDVAIAAGGSSSGAQGIASWIESKGHILPSVHRVLNRRGEINPCWRPAGPGLPANATEVQALLRSEGVRFSDGRADPEQRRRPERTHSRPGVGGVAMP